MLNKHQKNIIIKLTAVIFVICGCARVTEVSKLVMGTSVKALNDARPEAKSRVFEYDYPTCYEKVLSAIKRIKATAYLHSLSKHRIVAMNFNGFINTTEVGIFFTEVSPKSTKIEISSLSSVVEEYAAEKIFSVLNGTYREPARDSKQNKDLEKGGNEK